MRKKVKTKISFKVAEAVAAVISLPRTWTLPAEPAKLAAMVYGYHVGNAGARSGAVTTAHRTTWGRYEREARKLARAGVL